MVFGFVDGNAKTSNNYVWPVRSGSGLPFGNSEISYSPTSHDFGNVEPGNSSMPQVFTLSNTGTVDLVIGAINLTGTDGAEFSIQNDLCSGQTVAPAASCTIEAVFSPTSEDLKSANLSIPSNDHDTPTLNVSIRGTSLCTYSILPASQSFGSSGGTGSVSVSLTSGSGCTWTATSNVGWVSITSGNSGSGSGSVGYSVDVNNTTISRTGTMSIAGETFTITQTGKPDISISPTSHDFGNIIFGNTSQLQTFTVSNTGDEDLIIGTLSITGSDISDFNIQNDNCSGQTVVSSGSCTVEAVFSPTSEGARSANLSIPSNDPDTPTLEVQLIGTGCIYSILPTSQLFGSSGDIGSVSVSVSLTSGSGCTWTATSNVGWVSITSGNSGSGNGTVNYTVSANMNPYYRTATLTFAGQGFTVVQSGSIIGSRPTVSTGSANSVSKTSATLNGTVNPNGLSTTYYFQYGRTASYGSAKPGSNAGFGLSGVPINDAISNLIPNAAYHYRLVAANSSGTSYGIDMTFTSSSTSTWTIESVDAPKHFVFNSSRTIATDSNGHPHVAYGGANLYYTYYDGSNWNYETADSSQGVGGRASLALDSLGNAHISYYDSTNSDLKYVTNASGSWVAVTVDSTGDVDWGTSISIAPLGSSIALDSFDNVHISYDDIDFTDFSITFNIKYATNTSGTWVTTTVDKGGGGSIAIDSSDNAHISYTGFTGFTGFSNNVKYATNASGSWVTTIVDNDGWGSSIAIDSSDNVHIGYGYSFVTIDFPPDGEYYLNYATNASGSWVTMVVDNFVNTVGFAGSTSIAVDLSNNIHIGYYPTFSFPDLGAVVIKYATNVSGSWINVTLDTSETVGMYTSIAIDTSDKVHISYYDSTNKDLKYATNASGSWVAVTVDSSGDVGKYTSIALDSANNVHISYIDIMDSANNIKYATNASGSWVTEIVDIIGTMGFPTTTTTSIAINSFDKVHISYGPGLKYATNASGSWVTTTVDNDGGGSSIAIDSLDKVHISYYTGHMVKYATNASGSWITVTADSNVVVSDTSIAVDSSNNVHISYNDFTDFPNNGLKYATDATGTWVNTIVDSNFSVANSSIAIDSSGNVHICYAGNGLKYANNTSGTWVNETADSSRFVGWSSIAMDSSDIVHISYFDFINWQLKHATKNPQAINPLPDIKANGSDGPQTISQGDNLTVTVALDPGGHDGKNADWWVAATSLFGLYWYTSDSGWGQV